MTRVDSKRVLCKWVKRKLQSAHKASILSLWLVHFSCTSVVDDFFCSVVVFSVLLCARVCVCVLLTNTCLSFCFNSFIVLLFFCLFCSSCLSYFFFQLLALSQSTVCPSPLYRFFCICSLKPCFIQVLSGPAT